MSQNPYAITVREWDFIQEIDQRFPDKNIAANFTRYMVLPPEERVAQAKIDRQKLLRAGWIKRGVPIDDTETVDEHVEGMKTIAKNYLGFHENLATIIDIIEAHDTGEVIASDFIPSDPISAFEKRQIEYLATCVIYEAQPQMIERWVDYEDQRTPEAKLVKDLDKAQMYLRANAYGVTHPHIDLSEFEQDRQNYTCRTEEGAALYRTLKLST